MSKHAWFNVENYSYRNSAVPGFSLTRYRDTWLLSNSMLKDFSRAVYWEISCWVLFLLPICCCFFLIFECMAAKIINYRFSSSDCRANLAIIYIRLLLCFSCKDQNHLWHAIRWNRFRLVRESELHENRATSLRHDFVAFFFLMTTRCNYCSTPFFNHYHPT